MGCTTCIHSYGFVLMYVTVYTINIFQERYNLIEYYAHEKKPEYICW